MNIYEHPINEFVASFIGAANMIAGTISSMEAQGDIAIVETSYGCLSCSITDRTKAGEKVFISIKRDEEVSFSDGFVDFRISVGELTLRARGHPSVLFKQGDRVYIISKIGRYSILPVGNS